MQNLDVSKNLSDFPSNKEFIPPLENGDRLTRDEFHRRYELMPENIKAELINGVVYMSSPVRVEKHGKPQSHIVGILFNYYVATEGIELGDNVTFKLEAEGEPQPDAVLWIKENYGGKTYITDTDYLEGSPELIVEISSSTASYDLHDKKDAYERNGIKEYIVWRVLDKEIDWFVLQDGKYVRLAQDADGIIESLVFGGLRLNIRAILDNDLVQALRDLQTGIDSAEHKNFVESLRNNKKSS